MAYKNKLFFLSIFLFVSVTGFTQTTNQEIGTMNMDTYTALKNYAEEIENTGEALLPKSVQLKSEPTTYNFEHYYFQFDVIYKTETDSVIGLMATAKKLKKRKDKVVIKIIPFSQSYPIICDYENHRTRGLGITMLAKYEILQYKTMMQLLSTKN